MKQTKKLNLNKFKIASINKIGLGKIVGGDSGADGDGDYTTTDDVKGQRSTVNCDISGEI